MTQKEYIEKSEKLLKQLSELKKEYIKSNSPIPNGTKVKVDWKDWGGTEHTDTAFLVGYSLQIYNVVPCLKQLKKDGNPSNKMFYCQRLTEAKIEAI